MLGPTKMAGKVAGRAVTFAVRVAPVVHSDKYPLGRAPVSLSSAAVVSITLVAPPPNSP